LTGIKRHPAHRWHHPARMQPIDTQDALEASRRFGIKPIPVLRPFGWLARGARDLWRCPGPGLAHGLAAALWGALLVGLARDHFWLLAGAFSGFLIVAPIVATGLYQVSRELARGHRPTWRTAVSVWRPDDGRLIVFGVLLAFAGTGWVMTSASLITGFAGVAVDTPRDFLRHVVLAEEGLLFEAWLALGGVLAAPVFASSVVAIPLLLDRQVGVLAAVFTSWKVVMAHPAPMALWAALLMGLTLAGMATALLGLIVVVPWLAHASWHAYRDLVDAHGLPERP
jgi:uncharacterized membrane protein